MGREYRPFGTNFRGDLRLGRFVLIRSQTRNSLSPPVSPRSLLPCLQHLI
jgi:hypothetical protein